VALNLKVNFDCAQIPGLKHFILVFGSILMFKKLILVGIIHLEFLEYGLQFNFDIGQYN
jgi:hypothetical protein